MHDDPDLVRRHQAKALFNSYEAVDFNAARKQLGKLQKGTAATQLAVFAIRVMKLFPGIRSLDDLYTALSSQLMDGDVKDMEIEALRFENAELKTQLYGNNNQSFLN